MRSTGPTTLIQAIASAGGVSENGNPRRVAIFRQIGGQRQAAAFDLTSIRRGEAPDPQVYAGDIIVVDGSATKAAQRQILNTLADPVDFPALLTMRDTLMNAYARPALGIIDVALRPSASSWSIRSHRAARDALA